MSPNGEIAVQLTTADETHRRMGSKKSVTWATTIIEIPSDDLIDLSPEEVNATWYTERDYKAFTKESRMSVRSAKGEALFNGLEESCVRGLEHLVTKGRGTLRDKRRYDSITTVLHEQHKTSSKLVAALYAELCLVSIRDARETGRRDELEVYASTNNESTAPQKRYIRRGSRTVAGGFLKSNFNRAGPTLPQDQARRAVVPRSA